MSDSLVIAAAVIFALVIVGLPVWALVHLILARWAHRPIRNSLIALGASVVFSLAAITVVVPGFFKFHATSTCGEARTNLGAIFTTQVAYFGEPTNVEIVLTDPALVPLVELSDPSSVCGDGTSLDLKCFELGSNYGLPLNNNEAAQIDSENDPDFDNWSITVQEQIENLPSTDL